MPSLRQKVTTYFRQLSFIAEPRDSPRSARRADDDGSFITKYLEGRMERNFLTAPEIYNGHNPTDLPLLKIGDYPTGALTITAACTGPDDGLTGIKRSKLHLSASYADDIDFIDTIPESDCFEVRKSTPGHQTGSSKFGRYGAASRRQSAATTPTSDQNANNNNNNNKGMRSRKNSKTGIANLNKAEAKSAAATTSATTAADSNCSNKSTTIVVSMVSTKVSIAAAGVAVVAADAHAKNDQNNKNLLNAKTDATNSKLSSYQGRIKAADGTTTTTTATATTKLLESTTERLLREAVSNQCAEESSSTAALLADAIASVSNWKMESEYAYGIAVSLYENNMLTKEQMGNPIADCYGMVARGDAAILALADGVNWGDGARLAARSAVHGCLDYLDRAIFGLAQECMASSTQEVFVSLLRSLWEGHGCILEVGGALSTLTIAVVLPLAQEDEQQPGKYVVCVCNVGDSLGYVYSKKYGVRELTQASHDITSMRDMRDALGAIGPADGNKPELSNLTLAMTVVDEGDIVFLTSDGISDNFDPVVGKFAEAWTPDVKLMPSKDASNRALHGGVLAPKRANKSASAIYARLHQHDHQPSGNAAAATAAAPVRPQRTKKTANPSSSAAGPAATIGTAAPSRPKYMRSQTVIEPRRVASAGSGSSHMSASTALPPKIPKSAAGLPLVTGPQRHALTLYRLEDLLSYGINGTFSPCVSARRLCHLLIDFARMITSARRKTLEQRELFYKLATGPDGNKREVELNRMQHRATRKRIVDSSAFTALPGKLDHATVVAYTVGGSAAANTATAPVNVHITADALNAALQSKEFQETNF